MIRKSQYRFSLLPCWQAVSPDPIIQASGYCFGKPEWWLRACQQRSCRHRTSACRMVVVAERSELNRLVEAALANNPSLQAAQARIAQARATVRQERAGRLPTLGTQATVVQGRLPGLDIQNTAPPSPGAPGPQGQGDNLSIYNVGLNANWELDFAEEPSGGLR
jgi:hypothetical protein